ncbi:MAG: hypothetical protein AAB922_05965 [Patescibacteria group bacterium]
MEKTFEEKLWNDLVSLQKFQRNLLKSEQFQPQDFKDEGSEIWAGQPPEELSKSEARRERLNDLFPE